MIELSAFADGREQRAKQTGRKEIGSFEYGIDFSSSYFDYSRYCARIYGQKQVQGDTDLEYGIVEKQAKVNHLNQSGGSLNISTCKNLSNNKQRLCVQINKNAGEWQGGFMIPMGY